MLGHVDRDLAAYPICINEGIRVSAACTYCEVVVAQRIGLRAFPGTRDPRTAMSDLQGRVLGDPLDGNLKAGLIVVLDDREQLGQRQLFIKTPLRTW